MLRHKSWRNRKNVLKRFLCPIWYVLCDSFITGPLDKGTSSLIVLKCKNGIHFMFWKQLFIAIILMIFMDSNKWFIATSSVRTLFVKIPSWFTQLLILTMFLI